MSIPAASKLESEISHLAAIVGQEHLRCIGDTIAAAPADAHQVAEILRFANAHHLVVTPTGGGTKHGWGNPVTPDIRLSLARMASLREHAWQDMTCTVEAGCSWAAMQARLAQHGQMVALDPLWPEQATVGGVVAANDSGALRLRYGSPRDLVIGMTIAFADATIARSGGKVVKNVAGYDLHKLMTGSFGTLGVIVEINFRLHPLEKHGRTWTATAATPSSFEAPLRALLDAQMPLSSIQIRTRQQESALDMRAAATPECLEEYAARLHAIFGNTAVSDSAEVVWSARQTLFENPDAVILKISLLPSRLCSLSAELHQWSVDDGVATTIVAQATGVMAVALNAAPEAVTAFIARLRTRLDRSSAGVVALQMPDSLRGSLDVWDSNSDALPLMREIKARFDPNHILNPGRFVGGI